MRQYFQRTKVPSPTTGGTGLRHFGRHGRPAADHRPCLDHQFPIPSPPLPFVHMGPSQPFAIRPPARPTGFEMLGGHVRVPPRGGMRREARATARPTDPTASTTARPGFTADKAGERITHRLHPRPDAVLPARREVGAPYPSTSG